MFSGDYNVCEPLQQSFDGAQAGRLVFPMSLDEVKQAANCGNMKLHVS
jgi:hypothetical protein